MTDPQTALLDLLAGMDEMRRFDHLLDMAFAAGDAVDASLCRPENVFRGCQSTLWLGMAVEDGVLRLRCDSDALLVKALARFVCSLSDGLPPADAVRVEAHFFHSPLLEHIVSRETRTGLARLAEAIRMFAQKSVLGE